MKYFPTRAVQKEGGSLSSCLSLGSWFRYEGKSPGESPNRKSPIIVNAKNSCGTSSTCTIQRLKDTNIRIVVSERT